MKKRLFVTLIFLLSSCNKTTASPLNEQFESFKIENLSEDKIQHTRHYYSEYNEVKNGINQFYDYSITIDDRIIPISISGSESIIEKYSINNNPMPYLCYPTNSNSIKLNDGYLYFDGCYIHTFSSTIDLLSTKKVVGEGDDYAYSTSIFDNNASYILFSRYTEDSFKMTTIDKNTLEVISKKDVSCNSITDHWSEISFLYEVNSFYKNDLSEFIMNGYVYSYDSETNSISTDGFLVLEQPRLENGTYYYKAIKTNDNGFIYDQHHSFNVTSDKTIDTQIEYDFNIRGLVSDSIDLFLEYITTHGLVTEMDHTCTDYLKINDAIISHKVFDGYSFYSGYTIDEDNIEFEVTDDNKREINTKTSTRYFHFNNN